ncbi:MAG: uroporphyrinogen decarboxylase family protein [Bacillota bacterium]|nr:uroporphyrinogen decarboxylase family protein [Bacillota bacterium]
MNMKKWIEELKQAEIKKAMPILSFPSISLLNITVKELISNSNMQAVGMKAVSERCNSAATVSMMDLSVEAEAFGAKIKVSDDEVPTVIGRLIETPEDAEKLSVPKVGAGRTGIYIDAIKRASHLITDRPVFAGVIGPFSLSGRLMDMSEIMVNCYVEPNMVHTTLKKSTEFIKEYIKEFKQAGANGVIIAEPAAGLLSPELNAEFSVPYIKEIVEEVIDDDFLVIYHNCGNTIPLIKDILSIGASAYHFGNAVDLEEVAKLIPNDILFMGNVDPAREFRNGTPQSIKKATKEVMDKCCSYKNYVVSSGCDIPPLSSWENIKAFFEAVDEFYKR